MPVQELGLETRLEARIAQNRTSQKLRSRHLPSDDSSCRITAILSPSVSARPKQAHRNNTLLRQRLPLPNVCLRDPRQPLPSDRPFREIPRSDSPSTRTSSGRPVRQALEDQDQGLGLSPMAVLEPTTVRCLGTDAPHQRRVRQVVQPRAWSSRSFVGRSVQESRADRSLRHSGMSALCRAQCSPSWTCYIARAVGGRIRTLAREGPRGVLFGSFT